MKRDKLAMTLLGLLLVPVSGAAIAQNASSTDQAQTPQSQASEPQTGANQQNPPPQSGNTKQLQTVTVTGSAVPRIDLETPSPVTTISAQQIQRSGLTTVADVVRAVSADNSGSIPNAFTAGFAAGSSGVALRGLTVNSTLVLIDGHRAASYAVSDDGQRSFVDLNTIPIAAVDHIEVLKDGASSLYGADAIAGVVNVILKPGYRGIAGSVDVGTSQHGGGFTRKATLLAGGGDLDKDGYNAYLAVNFQKDNAIGVNQRPFPFNTTNLSSIGGPNPNVPSNNIGSIYGSVTNPNTGLIQPLRNCAGAPYETLVTNDPDSPGSYCEQNREAQYLDVQSPMEQGGVYGRATFKLNGTTKAYVSASYDEAKTWSMTTPAQIQTSTPVNTNNITLPADNPSNPFGVAAPINYAFGDIPRGTNYDNHNARVVADIAGTLGEWNYDAALVGNHTWLDTQLFGFLNYQGLLNAINNGTYDFADPASNSQAVRASIAPGYNKRSTSDLDSLDLSANRELWDLPGGPLGFGAGVQFRHEAQDDPTLNPGFEFQGLGNAQTRGQRNVSGAYVELDMPLLESLELDLSGRFDHYSDIGNGFTPKAGFKWKPTDWLAVRGTYSKGLRAPSFAENGSSSAQGFVTTQPPQSFSSLHGGNAYGTQPYAISEYTLANPGIKPEKAQNFTFGVLVQPSDWFSGSLDYYSIKKSNVITAPDYGDALDAYFANGGTVPGVTITPDLPDPAHPTALPRPIEMTGMYINANSLKTSGVDLDLRAHWKFDNGLQFISELSATQIFDWQLALPDGTKQSFVGSQGPYNLSSGAGTPRTRGSWANTVIDGPLTVTGTLYYTSGYGDYAEDVGVGPDSCLAFNASGGFLPASCRVGSFTDFDLTASYAINDKVSITGSIMNLFDREPPFDPSNYAAVNYNPTYSQAGIVGRFYNLGVKFKL
ncbi:MAG TPA: TonB-dependent receptor [Rhodanobacter sp.]